MLGLVALATVAAEPQCSPDMQTCYWRQDFDFGEAFSALAKAPPASWSTDLLCDAAQWRGKEACNAACPMQLVLTEPAELDGVTLCLKENSFQPYLPEAHVDHNHALHGQVLELAAPGSGAGDPTRLGCSPAAFGLRPPPPGPPPPGPPPPPSGPFAGKLVLIRRGACPFPLKFLFAQLSGAAAGVMVDDALENTVDSDITMVGSAPAVPAYFLPRVYGDFLFAALDAGTRVQGKLQLVCTREPAAPVPDDCPDARLISRTAHPEDAPCYMQQVDQRRLCVRCPLEARQGNRTACLWGGFLTPRVEANYLQHSLALALPEDEFELAILRDEHDACDADSFRGLEGRVVAFLRPTRCLPFEAARRAYEVHSIAGAVFLTHPLAKSTDAPVGLSRVVPIPVHTVAPYDTPTVLAFREHRHNSTATADLVTVGLKEGVMPRPVPVETAAPVVPVAEEPLPRAADALEWTAVYTGAVVACVVLVLAVVCVTLHGGKDTGAKAAAVAEGELGAGAAACSVSLGFASTALSLSLVTTVAVVAFGLTYAAGVDTTRSAVTEGRAAARRTYENAVENVDALSRGLRGTVAGNVVTLIHSVLDEGVECVARGGVEFLGSDATYDDIASHYDALVEADRQCGAYSLAFLSSTDFYADAFCRSFSPGGAAPATGAGLPYQGYMYDVNARLNKPWAPLPATIFNPVARVGADRALSRHDYVAGLKDGEMRWHVSESSQNNDMMIFPAKLDLKNTYKPLAVYSPVFNRAREYVGVAEARVKYDSIGEAVSRGVAGAFPNITVVVYDSMTRTVMASTAYTALRRSTGWWTFFQGVLEVNEASFTLDTIPPVQLNAYNEYSKRHAVQDRHSSTFDQAEYYTETTGYYVTQLVAEGAGFVDKSGNLYDTEMRDGACVDSHTQCIVSDPATGHHALQFDGNNKLYVYTNLTTDLPMVEATRVSAEGEPWRSSWPAYAVAQPVPGTSKECVATPGGCMLREAWIFGNHTVTVRFKPDKRPAAERRGWLFSDTLAGDAGLRILETGEVLVEVHKAGCRTEPIPNLDAMGWTTVTAVVHASHLYCESYVNGTLHSVSPMSQSLLANTGAIDRILAANAHVVGAGYEGLISEVAIMNISVTAEEALSIHGGAMVRHVPPREWYVDVQALRRPGGVDWAVASMVPKEDIMREIDANNEATTKRLALSEQENQARRRQRSAETIMVLAALVLLSVCVFMVFNKRLTQPVAEVAQLMTDAAYMSITVVPENTSRITELRTMYAAMGKMLRNLDAFRPYLPDSLFEDAAFVPQGRRDTAPGLSTGVVCLAFTDIQSSTAIWEASEEGMKKGLKIHNSIMRECIERYRGYEVKTVGDAFMVAFHNAEDACNFSLAAQVALNEAVWPEALMHVAQCADVPANGLRGIRVRIGVNVGEVECEFNPILKRYDYFGSTVNKAARAESSGVGGSVCITQEVKEELQAAQEGDQPLRFDVETAAVEQPGMWLKGCAEAANLTLLVPKMFPKRVAYTSGEAQKNLKKNKQPADPKDEMVRESSVGSRSTFSAVTVDVAGGRSSPMQHCAEAVMGKLFYTFGGDFLLNPTARSSLNSVIAKVLNALRLTEGTKTAVLASSVVVSWNTSKAAKAPFQKAVRFAKMMHNACFGAKRVPFLSGLHLGLCAGQVLQGNIGNKAQKFITSVGPSVTVAEQLCHVAAGTGAYCLAADVHKDVLPEGVRARPIDQWRTMGAAPLSFTVHEVFVECAAPAARETPFSSLCAPITPNGLDLQIEPGVECERLPVTPPIPRVFMWGWTAEYVAAFLAKDYATIFARAQGDEVLIAVAQCLRDERHLTTPIKW